MLRGTKLIFGSCWWIVIKFSSSILLCILGELAGGSPWLWLLALVTSDRWQVTPDTWRLHLTPDTWNVTADTYFFFKSNQFKKNFGAIICTRWEILYLPYAEFGNHLIINHYSFNRVNHAYLCLFLHLHHCAKFSILYFDELLRTYKIFAHIYLLLHTFAYIFILQN